MMIPSSLYFVLTLLRAIIVASESLYTVIVLYKTVKIWREAVGITGTRLVKAIIRDQAIFLLACVLPSSNLHKRGLLNLFSAPFIVVL